MSNNNLNPRIQAIKEITGILKGDNYKPPFYEDPFYRSLAGEAIRRLGEINFYLKKYIKKPLKTEQSHVKANLIIGAAQIIYMRVPAYAAVNDSVEIAKKNSPHHVKFINAILRQLSRDFENNKLNKSNVLMNIPIEIMNKWKNIFSEEQLIKIVNQHLVIPPALDISICPKENINKWKINLKGKILGSNNIRLINSYGKINKIHGYDQGKWWIQDIAAQLPVKILLSKIKHNTNVIDLCAAPGGKTAQLLTNNLKVTSLESNNKRTKILKENLNRLNLKTKLIVKDATQYKPEKLADALLLDAPCTSSGTLRKNPDILWRLSYKKGNYFSHMRSVIEIQRGLLDSASKMLKPGGFLIYSVCSMEKEEGENQIVDFIKKNSKFIIDPIKESEIDITKKAITKEGFIKTLPFFNSEEGGMDGFFIARLTKIN
jgi:16S rRNA (cytosine967-C5)-methyltransferase